MVYNVSKGWGAFEQAEPTFEHIAWAIDCFAWTQSNANLPSKNMQGICRTPLVQGSVIEVGRRLIDGDLMETTVRISRRALAISLRRHLMTTSTSLLIYTLPVAHAPLMPSPGAAGPSYFKRAPLC